MEGCLTSSAAVRHVSPLGKLIMANETQDKWRNEFEGRGQASWYWQQHARSLLCAANVLRERARLLEERPEAAPDRFVDPLRLMPIYVLYGYALENLIKGLLVARGETATWYGTLDKDIRHHDLQEFFRRGDVKLDKQEKAFLARVGLEPLIAGMVHIQKELEWLHLDIANSVDLWAEWTADMESEFG